MAERDLLVRDASAATELEEFQRAFGEFGGVERRYAQIGGLATRDNGDPDSLFSVSGSAIVFNRYSLDLGGFKEEIAPEAVRDAMADVDADYHLLWDHDTTLVLARNKNGTLNAEIGTEAVDFWGRVAKTSYAADLRVLMDRGDVDECSFAFTIADGGEEWRMEDDGSIVRRVTKIARLWDLTICARGAYPQTHSATVRSAIAGVAKERAGRQIEISEMTAEILRISKEKEERALQPGLVAWQDEAGYCDIACDIECQLEEREGGGYSVYWWVVDMNVRDGGQEAIVCRYEFGEGANYFLVIGITYDSAGEPVIPEMSEWTGVTMKWVAVPTEVVAEEGDGVVIIMDTASEAHERINRRIREADLKLAGELEARHAEPGTAEIVETPAVEETDEQPEETTETPEPAEETESSGEPETDETDETDASEPSSEQDEETELDADEERKRKAALARVRGRVALA